MSFTGKMHAAAQPSGTKTVHPGRCRCNEALAAAHGRTGGGSRGGPMRRQVERYTRQPAIARRRDQVAQQRGRHQHFDGRGEHRRREPGEAVEIGDPRRVTVRTE